MSSLPRVGPALLVVLPGVALLAAFPARAAAHGVEVPPQLPAPQWMFAWGATLALVASFVAFGAGWTRPRLVGLAAGRTVALPAAGARVGRAALQVAGLGLFGLTLWAGFTGSTHAEDNLAPTMVFAGFWVAVPVLSLVVGDVWRSLSPWRTVALIGEAARRRAGATRDGAPAPLSPRAERLAAVVAVLALVGFGWLELAAPDRDDPFVLASVAAGYAALMVLGAALLGRPFLDRADGFGRLFSLLAALSPLAWRDGALRLRPPAVGIAEVVPRRTVAAIVVVAIGIATFDGLSATAVWARGDAVGARLEDAMGAAGLSPIWSTAGAATVGLLGSIALVAVIVRLGTGRLPASDAGRGGRLGAFAPTLVPIAVAYLIAHYAGLLLVQGQVLVVRLSDPRGDGANLFGTAGWGVDLQPLSPEALWYVQIGALVLGHVAALAAAHDLALRSFPDRVAAARSQLPMLAAMVALTALGLRLVSGSSLR